MSSKYCLCRSAACRCNSAKLAAAATGFLLLAAWTMANWYGYNKCENGIIWAGSGWWGGNPRSSCWCNAAAAWWGLNLFDSEASLAKWCSRGGVGDGCGIGGVGLCLDECEDDFGVGGGRGGGGVGFVIALWIWGGAFDTVTDIDGWWLVTSGWDDCEDWCDCCMGGGGCWFTGGSIGCGDACANRCSISCSCCSAFTKAVFKRLVCSAFNAFFTFDVTHASQMTLESLPVHKRLREIWEKLRVDSRYFLTSSVWSFKAQWGSERLWKGFKNVNYTCMRSTNHNYHDLCSLKSHPRKLCTIISQREKTQHFR